MRRMGSGGMLPQEKFLKIYGLRQLLRPFLGLSFSLGMVTEFAFTTTRMEIGVHWHIPVELCEEAAHESLSKFCQPTLNLIPSNARQECVANTLTICLFSGLRSSLLRSDREVRVGTNLCWRVSYLPAKGQHIMSKQRSSNCQCHRGSDPPNNSIQICQRFRT